MGLDISSASDKDYHYSYRGLHVIRYMAYKSMGGKLDFSTWYNDMATPEATEEYAKARAKFPNLYWHSDCDGGYTLDGKVEPFDKPADLQTGNSKELLEELEFVKKNMPVIRPKEGVVDASRDRDAYIFYMFYDLVKDVVENHDGVIDFC